MQQLKQFKILLIGDNCNDEYHFGDVDRISPEAPVPVFKYRYAVNRPGMAANVAANLKALGCAVDFHRTQLNRKIRLIDQKSKYHIARIDYDIDCEPVYIDSTKTNYDAVVISDYDKGTVTYDVIDKVQTYFTCPIFLDTKKTNAEKFDKCFLKINLREFKDLKSYSRHMIITKGEQPVEYNNNCISEHYEVPNVGVHDVCGAGDTFLAALTYEYLRSNNMSDAIRFAIRASNVTIQYLGTHAPTLEEIK
jgi:D-beta-D-heptose 7-phosphate kinase/D-beta-D-heptose 1-phosphate adenosyltransferase